MSDHDHDKEHTITTDEIGPAHPAFVTPEEVAAAALDEADDVAEYSIQPAADPDEEQPDETADPEPTCLTAFLVIVQPDGSAFASGDLSVIHEIVPAREATVVDMRRGCDEVVHDVNAMQISQQTVAIMQQQAQAMAAQSQQQKMAEALQRRGLTVPGRGR